MSDLKAANEFERARKYYQHVLHVSLIAIEGIRERLDTLVLIRHAVAHCNGRIEAINENSLRKIRSREKASGGFSTDSEYLNFTGAFIGEMAETVKVALDDLIERVKQLDEC